MTFRKYFTNKKLAIFDLDGTIVDTQEPMQKALNNVLANMGTGPLEVFSVGQDLKETWEFLKQVRDLDRKLAVQDLVNQTYTQYLDIINSMELEPKDGFWAMINLLKNELKMKVALCTNTRKEVAQKILSKLDINDTFDFSLHGDEIIHSKPNPEIYSKILYHFKTPAKQTLAFEDSVMGSNAAISAGIDTFVIWDTYEDIKQFNPKSLGFTTNFREIIEFMDFDYDKSLKELAKVAGPKIRQ